MVQRTEFYRDGYDESVAVQQARTGEDLAFREIYERYYPGLRRYVFANTTNPHDAEDVMQEIFAKAFLKLEKYTDQGEGMKPWLTTIARNSLISLYHKNKRRNERSGEIDENHPASDNPAQTVVDRMEIELLLSQLDDDRRDAIEQVVVAGAPYAEYAVDKGIPKGTALSRVSRGRRILEVAHKQAMLDEINA